MSEKIIATIPIGSSHKLPHNLIVSVDDDSTVWIGTEQAFNDGNSSSSVYFDMKYLPNLIETLQTLNKTKSMI